MLHDFIIITAGLWAMAAAITFVMLRWAATHAPIMPDGYAFAEELQDLLDRAERAKQQAQRVAL